MCVCVCDVSFADIRDHGYFLHPAAHHLAAVLADLPGSQEQDTEAHSDSVNVSPGDRPVVRRTGPAVHRGLQQRRRDDGAGRRGRRSSPCFAPNGNIVCIEYPGHIHLMNKYFHFVIFQSSRADSMHYFFSRTMNTNLEIYLESYAEIFQSFDRPGFAVFLKIPVFTRSKSTWLINGDRFEVKV